MHTHDEHEACIRIDAPVGTDPHLIAQIAFGQDWLIKAEPREEESFGTYRAMRDLTENFCTLYEAILKKTLDECIATLTEEALAKGPIKPKPLLSMSQLRALAKMIRDAHARVVILGISPDVLTKQEVQRLINQGIVPKDALRLIDDAFMFGRLLAEIKATPSILKKETYKELKSRIRRQPIALTDHEKAAMNFARQSAAQYVVGLGNKIADDFTTMAIEADRKLAAQYRTVIKDALEENVERRETVRQLASEIGHRTGDWTRDLRRIAATEKQRAMQEGQRERLIARHGDPKTILVAKIPDPTACKHCVKLHLTGGPGSKPRIFKLSELEKNGTNVGRKAADWRATVGPVHPWCACELVYVPEGWEFDEKSDLVPALRKAWTLAHDLRKALSYSDAVPEHGVTVRVGDPAMVSIIDDVIARTPAALFNKRTGVTLITTDHPNANSHLEDHDYAYWTGNEVRVAQSIPLGKLKKVVEHELAHALNVYLLHKFGSTQDVRAWHSQLDAISKQEGYVSEYAKKLPIENAAEVTRFYLYHNDVLRRMKPKQYTFVHRAYQDLFTDARTQEAFGLTMESSIDLLSAEDVWRRFDIAVNRHGMTTLILDNGARIYTLGNEGDTLAIMSGIHGEERAGPIALLRWLEDTEAGDLLLPDVKLWMCPLFVAKGWDRLERGPENIDYNGVWIPGAEGRTRSVRQAEASLRKAKPKVFIDLHEDAHGAVLPYIYGYEKDRTFVPALARDLAVRIVPWKGSDETSFGATETFAYSIGCKQTSTIETPTTASLAARVAFHLDAVRWCVNYVSENAT